MVEITAHREISTPVDWVWSIVSDLDSEPRYLPDLKAVYNISKTDNVIEREVTVETLET